MPPIPPPSPNALILVLAIVFCVCKKGLQRASEIRMGVNQENLVSVHGLWHALFMNYKFLSANFFPHDQFKWSRKCSLNGKGMKDANCHDINSITVKQLQHVKESLGVCGINLVSK